MLKSDSEDFRKSVNPPKETTGRACTICGDKANGFNFGVLTCESCKAFFRRNASKHKEIKCPFSNNCQITSESRKFCQACRLNKCFSSGMNSEWLSETKSKSGAKVKRKKLEGKNSDVQKDDEQISVSKNYLQKLIKKANENQNCCICKCTCGFYSSDTRLTACVSPIPRTPSIEQEESIKSVGSSTQSTSFVASSPMSPYAFSMPPTPYISSPAGYSQNTPSLAAFSNAFNTSSPGFMSPFQLRGPILPCDPSAFTNVVAHPSMDVSHFSNVIDYRKTTIDELLVKIRAKLQRYSTVLTSYEMDLLEELHYLNDPLTAPLEKNYNSESLQGVFQIVEEALRRIISMTAGLKAFRELDIEDRKKLIKSGFCELLIVRGIMAYNKSNSSWNHRFATNTMEIKFDVLKQHPNALEHYKVHKKFLESFCEEMRSNDNIMLIFNAIVIFHSSVSDLKDSSKVHATQAKYFAMLLKILTFEFPKEKGERFYEQLLHLVIDLHGVNQTMLHLFYGVDPSQLDPLVRELCNFT